MSSLLSNGTAPITEATLLQLSSKHPERSKPVCWPDPHPRETSEPRTGQHQPVIPMGAQMDIASIHPQMDIDRPEETAHPKMDIDNHEEKDPEKTTANMEIERGWMVGGTITRSWLPLYICQQKRYPACGRPAVRKDTHRGGSNKSLHGTLKELYSHRLTTIAQ